jgi:hypothetical protein
VSKVSLVEMRIDDDETVIVYVDRVTKTSKER